MSLQQLQSKKGVEADDLRHFLTLASFLGPINIAEFLFEWPWKQHDDDRSWMCMFIEVGSSESEGETSSMESGETHDSASGETTDTRQWSHKGF